MQILKTNLLKFIVIAAPILILNEFSLEKFVSPDQNIGNNFRVFIRKFNILCFLISIIFLKKIINLLFDYRNYLAKELSVSNKLRQNIYNQKNLILFTLVLSITFIFGRIFLDVTHDLSTTIQYDIDIDIVTQSIEKNYQITPYGVLYPKIANFLHDLLFFTNIEYEELRNLTFIIINFLSINIIAICCASFFRNKIDFFLIFFVVLLFLVSNNYWHEYLFRVRVDLLFTAFISLFCYYFIKYLKNPNFYLIVILSLLTSLALQTKLTAIIFLILFITNFVIFSLIKKLDIKYIFLNFLVICITNIFLYKIVSNTNIHEIASIYHFIKWISYFSETYSFKSFFENIQFITHQSFIGIMILVILIYASIFRKKKISFTVSNYNLMILFFFTLIPVVYLSKVFHLPLYHYFFPMSAIIIINLFNIISKLKIDNITRSIIFLFIILFSFKSLIVFKETYEQRYVQKNNAYNFLKFVEDNLDDKNILVDGYVPRKLNNNQYIYCGHLKCNFNLINQNDISIIALNKKDASRVLNYNRNDKLYPPNVKNIPLIIRFYKLFVSNKNLVEDENGIVWKKIKYNELYLLWEKI